MTQTTSQVEAAAKLIYETWKDIPEYRLWKDGGNSLKQSEARRIARQVIELASQQEVAAPVGVVSVSPLHVGVGWVGGYVPKNGEKLYLAAARVPVASPAEPVAWRRKEDGGWWVYYETKAHDDLEPLYGGAGVMDARPETMEIRYETFGNCLWHTDCKVNSFKSGVMQVLSHENTSSTMKCLSCGQVGAYPKGRVGTVCVPVISTDAAILASKGGDQGEGK